MRQTRLVGIAALVLAICACESTRVEDVGAHAAGASADPGSVTGWNFDLGSKRFDHFSVMNVSGLPNAAVDVVVELRGSDDLNDPKYLWRKVSLSALMDGEQVFRAFGVPNNAEVIAAVCTAKWYNGSVFENVSNEIHAPAGKTLCCVEFWFGEDQSNPGMMEIKGEGALNEARISGTFSR